MIINAHQRAVTCDRIARFEASLASFDTMERPSTTHELLWAAQRRSIVSILDDLRAEVEDYDRSRPLARVRRLPFLFWLAGFAIIVWIGCSLLVWPLLIFGIFIPGHVYIMRREWRRTNET